MGGHNDIHMRAAPGGVEMVSAENVRALVSEIQRLRDALLEIHDECFSGAAHDIAARALTDAAQQAPQPATAGEAPTGQPARPADAAPSDELFEAKSAADVAESLEDIATLNPVNWRSLLRKHARDLRYLHLRLTHGKGPAMRDDGSVAPWGE